jgi:AcrR family transcriptional regulator
MRRYCANKDELVIAALQRRDERWMQWLRDEVERREGTGERLLALFSALKDWFGTADFRGCAFINTSGETGDPRDPVRLLAKKAKAGKIEDVETSKDSEERKSADVIDLTELLKRSLAGKPTKKPAAKKSTKAS